MMITVGSQILSLFLLSLVQRLVGLLQLGLLQLGLPMVVLRALGRLKGVLRQTRGLQDAPWGGRFRLGEHAAFGIHGRL